MKEERTREPSKKQGKVDVVESKKREPEPSSSSKY
jgi:hypothetical protein